VEHSNNKRIDEGRKSLSKEYWCKLYQQSLKDQQERQEREAKEARERRIAATFQKDTERWQARDLLDQIIFTINTKLIQRTSLNLKKDDQWVEQDNIFSQKIENLEIKKKEAKSRYDQKAKEKILREHPEMATSQASEETATFKTAQEKLKQEDTAVNQLREEFIRERDSGMFSEIGVRQNAPVSEEEITTYQKILREMKQTWLLSSPEEYALHVQEKALEDAREEPLAMKEAWRLFIVESKQGVNDFKTLGADEEALLCLEQVAQADEAAYQAFQKEAQRLDDIKTTWIEQFRKQQQEAKEKREQAAQQHHEGSSLPWIMLSLQERQLYNDSIQHANEVHEKNLQQEIEESEKEFLAAQEEVDSVENSFFVNNERKESAQKRFSEAQQHFKKLQKKEKIIQWAIFSPEQRSRKQGMKTILEDLKKWDSLCKKIDSQQEFVSWSTSNCSQGAARTSKLSNENSIRSHAYTHQLACEGSQNNGNVIYYTLAQSMLAAARDGKLQSKEYIQAIEDIGKITQIVDVFFNASQQSGMNHDTTTVSLLSEWQNFISTLTNERSSWHLLLEESNPSSWRCCLDHWNKTSDFWKESAEAAQSYSRNSNPIVLPGIKSKADEALRHSQEVIDTHTRALTQLREAEAATAERKRVFSHLQRMAALEAETVP